jgi:hypothetical protein
MLHERQDFGDLLTIAGERLDMNQALIEKDYWVTEALRMIAAKHAEGVVFKGGTSLSKAWGLVKRFSEDIDLLIRQDDTTGGTGGSRDRYMKEIEAAVGELDGLERTAEGSRSDRGISRTSVLTYAPRTSLLEGLRPTIILEMGIRGGAHPTEVRPLRSLISTAIEAGELEDQTLEPFDMTVLDPRRTLVEKLFAIHSACELWYEGRSTAIQRQGRHLYDIHFLLGDDDVSAYLGGHEYLALLPEIDEFGRQYFPQDHRTPRDMRLSTSRALNPGYELRAAIEEDYQRSRFLFADGRPTLEEIYARIAESRDRL